MTDVQDRWAEWLQQDSGALHALIRGAGRTALTQVFDGTHGADAAAVELALARAFPDLQREAASALLDLRGTSSQAAVTRVAVGGHSDRRAKRRGRWVYPVGFGSGQKSYQPPTVTYKPPVADTNPNHPLQRVKTSPTPTGYFLAIQKDVAALIASWWVGRQSTEWSALAVVDGDYYGVLDPTTGRRPWRGVIKRVFRNDDLNPDANGYLHRDSGAGTVMMAEWEAMLFEQLIAEGKADDITRLRCHIHSHNTMDAFWSTTDVNMRGALLDEQAAPTSVKEGWHCAIVVGNNLQVRGAIDGWTRKEDGTLDYWTMDDVPVKVKWDGLQVPLKEVLDVRRDTTATVRAVQPVAGAVGAARAPVGAHGAWYGEDMVDF